MSGSLRYSRALSAEVGDIERRLRSLEQGLASMGVRLPTSDARGGLSDAVVTAMSGWADRLRRRASALGGQTTIGTDAAGLGGSALNRVSSETAAHPFFALAVAVGVGVLIGMASRGWD
jgi:hypothetical protein